MKDAPLIRNPELGASHGADNNADETSADLSGSTPGPVSRRNQTPFDPPRRSRWKQFWKWTGVFALLAFAGVFAYLKLTPHGQRVANTIHIYGGAAIEAKLNPQLIFERDNSDVINILLIGRDVNWEIKRVYDPTRKIWAKMQVPDEKTPARSDTMLIVSLDRNRNLIHMVSLPRDAMVQMPENKIENGRAKLNAAHAFGGPELLVKTIHDELGITIHHYAVIRFEGFKKLIDQVGGVEVDVLGALKRDGKRGNLDYDDKWGNLHIHLKPGKQVLNGEQAHNYVRFRMDLEGDPGRIKRQQQVMRALAKKLTSPGQFFNLPALLQEIRKQFKTDAGFDPARVASAADFAKSIGDSSKIQPVTLFGAYTTRGKLYLNESKNKKLLSYIFGPTFHTQTFLANSPSTEDDEMGEENNSSPGAKAILRRAGIIKGGADEAAPAGSTPGAEETSAPAASEVSSAPATSEDTSRLATSRDSSHDNSSTSRREERPRRRARPSRDADSQSTPDAPSRRTRTELSTPDEAPSGDESAADESPVPVPEGQSTPDAGDSPVPQAE